MKKTIQMSRVASTVLIISVLAGICLSAGTGFRRSRNIRGSQSCTEEFYFSARVCASRTYTLTNSAVARSALASFRLNRGKTPAHPPSLPPDKFGTSKAERRQMTPPHTAPPLSSSSYFSRPQGRAPPIAA